jgi:indolepyruvate ferredoxin oxidoreductase beta subunit
VGARAAAQDEVVDVRANSRVSGAPPVHVPANADTALHPPTLDGRYADAPTPGGAPPRAAIPFDPELHRYPEAARDIVRLSLERLVDYQGADYARLFIDRLRPIVELESGYPEGEGRLTAETARQLVLGMSYEDAIRVAELKIRPSRFQRVGEEVRAGDGQILQIAEFMHPRMQEIADTLPANLGRWLLRPGGRAACSAG